MRREKNFKRSLLLLAVMSVMIFAMAITASAASAVTGLKQTGDSRTSVTVQWDANGTIGERYRLAYDTSKTGRFSNTSYTTSSTSLSVSGLQAGCTYYVKVQTLINNNVVAETSPIQVVTRPDSVDYKTVKQSSGTAKKIGVTWGKVPGATAYKVVKYYNGKPAKSIYTSNTKAVIPVGAGRHYGAYIHAYRKADTGYVAIDPYGSTAGVLYSAPVNPQYFADAKSGNLVWKPAYSGNVITIGWKPNPNYDYPTGYQVQIYSVDGKTRLYTTSPLTGRQVTINNGKLRKAINNKGFKVRVRAYTTANSGVKCWSAWSAYKMIIPQACIKKGTVVGNSGIKVTWPKVANTQYYMVYYSKNPESSSAKWSKKKVSASTTSFTISGLKKYQYCGIYVVPYVKIGGKTYSATATEYYSAYIRTVYN